MKRFFNRTIMAIAMFCTLQFTATAQLNVGSNTAPDSDAMLEISGTNKGLLLPRLALSATNNPAPLTSFVAGMVIYNTATAGTSPNNVTPGFYVCDGNQWIATGSKLNASELTSATSPTGDFIGQMIYNTNSSSGLPVGPAYWNGTQWVSVAGSNIYNADGTLSANRIVAQGGYSLTFTGTGNTILNSGSVGVGTSSPVASAKLDVTSTTQGFLPPRMTSAQMNAIATPADGLIIYCTDCSPAGWHGYSTTGGWQPFITTSSSSNGSARVSAWDCSGTLTGTLSQGTAASGVTKVVTATVTQVGTYSITATASGVTFSASGTFASTGTQNVTLNASGTPSTSGNTSFSLNTTPNCSFNVNITPSSSGGTAAVATWNCSGALTGTLTQGQAVSGVTKVVTANVTTAGTYNISATANGVTFSASGTFASTGSQNVTLTASGTPSVAGTSSFTLNTTPNCSFNATTIDPSSGGGAVVSSWNCGGALTGIMLAGQAVSGVTKVVTATVTTVGTYSISATANGVTFSGSGTFASTGSQNVTLTASGTPTAAGTNSFTLNTTPNCSFSATAYTSIAKGDYVMVRRTSGQSIGTNTDIIYNTVVEGNIPYNTSTGVFTLTAGKVYRITFQGGFSASSAFLVSVRLFDAATNTSLYSNQQLIRSKTTTNSVGGSTRGTYILAPTTNQTIKFQATTAASGVTLFANTGGVLIEELGISQTGAASPTVDYMITRRSGTDQTGVGVNNDVILNTSPTGNIPLNTTTGVVSLTGGKTYRLTSDVRFINYSNTDGRLSYTWVDATTNTPINNFRNMTVDLSSGSTRTGLDHHDVIYTPSSNQTVKLRVTFVGATGMTADVSVGYAAVSAQELGISSLGNTLQYAYVMRSTDQTGIGGSTNLVFDDLQSSNGIPYNTSTGVFTLTAGKTYRLSFGADYLSFSNTTGGAVTTTWVDAITNTPLTAWNALAYPASLTTDAVASNNIEMIYTPSTNQTIRLRTTSATGTATMNANNNYAIVQEIGYKVQ